MALFTAIAGAVGSFFASLTVSTVAGFALKTLASVGLSAAAQKLAGKDAEDVRFGVRTRVESGADSPQAFISGRGATAGTVDYQGTTGGDSGTASQRMVVTLSDLPIGGVTGLWVRGVKRDILPVGTQGTSAIAGYQSTPGQSSDAPGNYLAIRYYDGTQTTADARMVSEFGSRGDKAWDANAVGFGRAYGIVYAFASEDYFRNGYPNIIWEVEGIKYYNPAKDSTVGGDGAHRWHDESTWEPSENPAVAIYNILRGIRYNGEWVYGLQGVTAAQLPVAHWIGEIDRCDTLVDTQDGQEPLYRASGEIPLNSDPFTVIQAFLTACNGRLSDARGTFKLFVGGARTSVMSFTDDDILTTHEQVFSPLKGLADTVNGITGTYPAPDAGWQVEASPPLYRPDYEAEDGGFRLLANVPFDLVPYPEQVQRLQKEALNMARRARTHVMVLPPRAFALEPGDVIDITSARNGYIDKQFRVDALTLFNNGDVAVEITEIDPTDSDWDTNTDFVPPATPGVDDEVRPSQAVAGFAVVASSVKDSASTPRRPAILATWDTGDPVTGLTDVEAIKIVARVKATGDVVARVRTDTPEDGQLLISDGILPNVEYEVRARYVTYKPRPLDWTSWLSVTTPNLLIGSGDIGTDLDDRIQGAEDGATQAGIDAGAAIAAANQVSTNLNTLTDGFTGSLPSYLAAFEEDLRSEFGSYTSMLSVGDFSNGSGDWEATDHTIVTSTTPALPNGVTHAMRMDARNLYDGAMRVEAGMADRVFRFTGWVLTEGSAYDARIAVQTTQSDGVTTEVSSVDVQDAGVTGWRQFTADVTLPSDVISWRPGVRSNSASGVTAQNIFWAQLSLRDVTGIEGLAATLENEYRKAIDQDGATTAAIEAFRSSLTDPAGEIGLIWAEFSNNRYTQAQADQAITLAVTSASATLNARMDGIDGDVLGAVSTSQAYTDSSVLALSQPGGAVAVLSDELAASVTTLRGEMPGYAVRLDTLDKLAELPGGVLGPSALGQTAVVEVRDQGQIRSTSGTTNGDVVLQIPDDVAARFAGRKIKINILAWDHGSLNGMSVAYSTSDNGNSGEMTTPLTGAYEWVSFYYDVPVADTGGAHYLAIWAGETSGTGNAIRVAHVTIEVAAEAADLPEIEALTGSVSEIRAVDINALAGTAFGTLLTQLDVDAGGTSATVAQQGAALTDLEGNASASLVFRAKAGGASGEVEVTAFEDADGGPSASVIRLGSDVIQLDGLAVFEAGLQGAGFDGTISANGENILDAGTAGYAITKNNAVFNQLIVRNSIVDGSISDRLDDFQGPSTTVYTSPAVSAEDAVAFVFGLDEMVRATTISGRIGAQVEARTMRNGSWGVWDQFAFNEVVAGTATPVRLALAGLYAGFGEQVQFRVTHVNSTSGGGGVGFDMVVQAWGVVK